MAISTVKKPKRRVASEGTVALHAKSKDGSKHAVGIGNLRVMILNDDGSWFAQGLEIDYAAQGSSLDDVKARFERGLVATVSLHIKTFGGIKNLLRPAPADVWVQLAERACEKNSYSQVSVHKTNAQSLLPLPFDGIDYFQDAAS